MAFWGSSLVFLRSGVAEDCFWRVSNGCGPLGGLLTPCLTLLSSQRVLIGLPGAQPLLTIKWLFPRGLWPHGICFSLRALGLVGGLLLPCGFLAAQNPLLFLTGPLASQDMFLVSPLGSADSLVLPALPGRQILLCRQTSLHRQVLPRRRTIFALPCLAGPNHPLINRQRLLCRFFCLPG